MRSMIHRTLVLAVSLIAVFALSPAPATAQGGVRQQSRALTTADIIAQLGVSVADSSEEFDVGANFTGTLREPAKLEHLGITGMHKGARVTAVRITPEKVRVEADEIEPKPARGAVTLHIDARGTLSPAGRPGAGK